MINIVCGANYCSEFHKSQFQDNLFIVFIWDMFYFLEDFDIANYADDSTS